MLKGQKTPGLPDAELITRVPTCVLLTAHHPVEKHRGEGLHKHSTEDTAGDRKSESLGFSPTTCLRSALGLLICRVTGPLRGRRKKNGHVNKSMAHFSKNISISWPRRTKAFQLILTGGEKSHKGFLLATEITYKI